MYPIISYGSAELMHTDESVCGTDESVCGSAATNEILMKFVCGTDESVCGLYHRIANAL